MSTSFFRPLVRRILEIPHIPRKNVIDVFGLEGMPNVALSGAGGNFRNFSSHLIHPLSRPLSGHPLLFAPWRYIEVKRG